MRAVQVQLWGSTFMCSLCGCRILNVRTSSKDRDQHGGCGSSRHSVFLLTGCLPRTGPRTNYLAQKRNIKRMRAFSHLRDPVDNDSLPVPLSQPYPPGEAPNTSRVETTTTSASGDSWCSQRTALAIVLIVVGILLLVIGAELTMNIFAGKKKSTRNKPSNP